MITPRFFPRRRALLVAAPAVLAALAIAAWAYAKNKPDKAAEIVAVAVAPAAAVRETDSDDDGLKDWEEALWRTDMRAKDTDGDGTTDGDEVRMSRNPTTASPGDELRAAASFTAALSAAPNIENLTRTEIFSRMLLGQAIDLEQAGGGVPPSSGAQLFSQLGAGEEPLSAQQVAIADVAVVPDGPAALRTYGNALGAALAGPQTEATSEVIIFGQFAQTKNTDVLAKLSAVAANYERLANQLRSTPVPQSLAQAHLSFVNSFFGIAASLERMSVIATDPLAGLFGIEPYQTYSDQQTAAFESIRQNLVGEDVTFEASEPGYLIVTYQAPRADGSQ